MHYRLFPLLLSACFRPTLTHIPFRQQSSVGKQGKFNERHGEQTEPALQTK
jgi:hypothetical protein